jgi:hypothetical protein
MTGALLLVVSVVLGYWLAFTARWFFEFLPHGGVW